MNLAPRAKLALIAAGFAAPIALSLIAYRFFQPPPTANHGELLLPPAIVTAQPFERTGGGRFGFSVLAGQWVLIASDSGRCTALCVDKLEAMRQVRLALGRDAGRVARVLVVDDLDRPDAQVLLPFEGTIVALTPRGMALPAGAANDRAHVYLVDPHGNVIMRWPAPVDRAGMLKDLQRLLKASQIG